MAPPAPPLATPLVRGTIGSSMSIELFPGGGPHYGCCISCGVLLVPATVLLPGGGTCYECCISCGVLLVLAIPGWSSLWALYILQCISQLKYYSRVVGLVMGAVSCNM